MVRFWAHFNEPKSRYPFKHRKIYPKGAILGVAQAHISRLKGPTFFKLFT